ncbi:phospholipase B1, membrane-associated-like [Haliotis cracherodii]|uniref:phospholipase B1, membrane-associated-like n=1 Tax=Haliotis cracherodii TaxID=6455 RepID=UPI0039E9C395
MYSVAGAPFPCTVYPPSPTVPTSVHALRPGDVKVVGALGDSITAALGADASNIFGVLTEYRGLSWSIGGDGTYEDQETLPNILKRYNPNLKGYSVGKGDSEDKAHLNVADTGSVAADLPKQARLLIDRMNNDAEIDVQNDWKVITIMTGGNDICDVCTDAEGHSPDRYIESVIAALDLLQTEVPRVLVNLVETINVEIAKDLNKGLLCTVLHVACRCAAFPDGAEGEELIVQTTNGYHSQTEQLVSTGRYDIKDDFTVVVQPFLKETFLPRTADGKPDFSFFAPDCFHLSRKGQAAAANSLWDNMIEREGGKRVSWTPGQPIECPSEASPFFFTRKNSNATAGGVRRDGPMLTGDVKGDSTNEEEINGTNNGGSEDHTVAIGTSFLVLVGVGFILTLLWTIKRRRGPGANKYQTMDEETVWEKHSPATKIVKQHSIKRDIQS